MAYRLVGLGAAVSAVIAAGLVAACTPSVASMSCDRIAEEAKQTSQAQQFKINSITNLREVSRTEAEARCQGNAAWSDNTTTDIYLRAYQQNGNTMVAYSATGFEAPGAASNNQAPQPAAPPPAQGEQGQQ